jgi:hypothetical protein
VPLRVISEGMGAYVLWVADKRLVVVRYLTVAPSPPPTPPATPVPTAVPTAAPTATPTPTPKATTAVEFFVAGDGLFDPQVYNEFSPGNKGGTSLAGRAGITFSAAGLALMAEANFIQFRYPHRSSDAAAVAPGGGFPCTGPGAVAGEPGCVSTLGPAIGSAFVPSFDARDTDIDGRFGIGIANPKIFLAGSYMDRYVNYGYPRLTGVGGGLEKLTNYKQPIDIYGSVYYYPQLSGNYTDINGDGQKLQYRMLHYQAGLNINVPKTPIFLDIGYEGDRGIAKQNAPTTFSENSFYGGLGLHF